jgi:hypothetical protein
MLVRVVLAEPCDERVLNARRKRIVPDDPAGCRIVVQ